MNDSVVIDTRCKYKLTMQLPAAAAAAGGGDNASVLIDSVVLLPDYKRSTAYADAGKLELPVCWLRRLF